MMKLVPWLLPIIVLLLGDERLSFQFLGGLSCVCVSHHCVQWVGFHWSLNRMTSGFRNVFLHHFRFLFHFVVHLDADSQCVIGWRWCRINRHWYKADIIENWSFYCGCWSFDLTYCARSHKIEQSINWTVFCRIKQIGRLGYEGSFHHLIRFAKLRMAILRSAATSNMLHNRLLLWQEHILRLSCYIRKSDDTYFLRPTTRKDRGSWICGGSFYSEQPNRPSFSFLSHNNAQWNPDPLLITFFVPLISFLAIALVSNTSCIVCRLRSWLCRRF